MKKAAIVLAVFFGLSVMFVATNHAEDRTFVVSATVPGATGVSISASRIDSTTGAFTAVTGSNLSFDPLTLDTVNGIFLPDHFFAIDVGAVGGSGSPDVTVSYTEGANPNGTGPGLGTKATATFVRVEGPDGSQTETALTAHGPKKMLKDLTNEAIDNTELTNGFLRIYLGIVTGDPNATFPDPTGSEPFTAADAAGLYDGTLVVSATAT